MQCKYCEKDFSDHRARNGHMAKCRSNPNAKPLKGRTPRKRLKKEDRYAFHRDPEYQEKQRKIRLALIANGLCVSDEDRKIRSETALKYWANEENRLQHSIRMKQAVIDNIDSYTKSNVVGRVRNIDYNGHTLKGSWEVTVAEALDAMGILWEQPSIGIPYPWKGSDHLYFPDFYLPEYNIFLEVKGYERERDRAKWAVVKNLTVLKVDAIRRFREEKYDWFVRGMVNGEPGHS